MPIVATFHPAVDGRTVARATRVYVLPQAGNYAISLTVTELRTLERVMQWNLTTDPLCDPGTPTNPTYSGNTVDCTLIGVGSGTTLTAEIIGVGF